MVEVRVSEGVLEGELVNNEYGGTFYSFKGIPYAEPPLGELRFKAPQPKKPWSGVRSAKEFGPKCYQVNIFKKSPPEGSEDCLYLNVDTPDIKPTKPLPVMFWIHGGAFVSGSGDDDDYGPEFLVNHGVILVTINYRLETLGFLCLDTKEVPGNAGMKDQVAALRWVNRNIANFGGDPNNITIFGQSAGAVSVSYHLVSPMTKGLFKRAIVQSGASTCSWAQIFEPRERALALARQLGWDSNGPDIYDFLKKVDIRLLIQVRVPITFSEITREGYDLNFGVVSEKQFEDIESFFKGDIFEILPDGIHEGVEIITGYTEDEGVLLYLFNEYQKVLTQAKNFAIYFTPNHISLNTPMKKHVEVGRKFQQFYLNDPNSKIAEWERLAKYTSMEMFIYSIVDWAKICASKHTVYMYKFTCKSERNVISQPFGFGDEAGYKLLTNHADDLFYLFKVKTGTKVDIKSQTYKMIQNMTTMWTNFAKYGNPTPDDSLGVLWKTYNTKTEEYLNIGNVLETKSRPNYEEIQFWEDIFRQYAPKLLIR